MTTTLLSNTTEDSLIRIMYAFIKGMCKVLYVACTNMGNKLIRDVSNENKKRSVKVLLNTDLLIVLCYHSEI